MFHNDAAYSKNVFIYNDGLICSFVAFVSKGWQQVLTQSFIFSVMSALSICRYSNVIIKYTDVKSQNFRRHSKRCDNDIYMKQIILFVAIASCVSYIQISSWEIDKIVYKTPNFLIFDNIEDERGSTLAINNANIK